MYTVPNYGVLAPAALGAAGGLPIGLGAALIFTPIGLAGAPAPVIGLERILNGVIGFGLPAPCVFGAGA